jgi:ElaB/YqjD/DUF883 family membrane-anchored ribosome-binding protein
METTTEMNRVSQPRKGHTLEDLRDQTVEKVRFLRERAVEGTKKAARTTDQYIHEHTWTTIAVAAALGCVVGVLLARRRD